MGEILIKTATLRFPAPLFFCDVYHSVGGRVASNCASEMKG
jgi:hypothetical protein